MEDPTTNPKKPKEEKLLPLSSVEVEDLVLFHTTDSLIICHRDDYVKVRNCLETKYQVRYEPLITHYGSQVRRLIMLAID